MSLAAAPTPPGGGRWVGATEACQILGVHVSTLRQWTARGQLRAFLTPGGHRRYRETELRTFRARPSHQRVRRSLAAAILTMQPRCGFSTQGSPGAPADLAASETPGWLSACDEASRRQPRLLGGALARLLARYVATDGQAEAAECLTQAREDAAAYRQLADQLDLSPAAAIEAFTICRAPIVETARRWATDLGAFDPQAAEALARVNRFFDEALLSMVASLEQRAP